MKKIISLMLILILCLSLTACGTETVAGESYGNKLVKVYEKGSLQEYKDVETGVHYFIISSGYSASVTPRYDADGNIYVEKED